MLDFNQFKALTFDCYGTLIDWESGILGALRPMLSSHGVNIGDDELLKAYSQAEAAAESRAFRPYRQVLQETVRALGERFSFQPSIEEQGVLPDSIKTWLPFSDSVVTLNRLRSKFKLSIISNIDDDLFAASATLLQVPFDFVTTALEVRSYKPSLNNFDRALEKMKIDKRHVLHVAQSRHHDIEPANRLGMHSVWVNRRAGKSSGNDGASGYSNAIPDLEVPDLKTLADVADC
jgi:2-haloacid dehalogenase